MVQKQVRQHYDGMVDHWNDQYSPGYAAYPANQKRLELLLARLGDSGARTVLDCGCGEGSPLREMRRAGIDGWGFDFSAAMVARAKENLDPVGWSDRVWQGDVTTAIELPEAAPREFDAVIAMGVFPHISDRVLALQNMACRVRSGGRMLVEFRNALFGLFSLNRYSFDFLTRDLMQLDGLRQQGGSAAELAAAVEQDLRSRLHMDLPPKRTGREAPGYDEILSQLDNPFTIDDLLTQAGLRPMARYFYHFHAVPPLYERTAPDVFRARSLDMEREPSDWRGHFMASAFIVEASVADSR